MCNDAAHLIGDDPEPSVTDVEFQNALMCELQALGAAPTSDAVTEAILRLQAAGPPAGSSFEGLVFQWSLAKAREAEHGPNPGELVGDSLSRELLGDDPEPEDGWVDFDEDGNLLPRQPPVPSEWDWKQKDAPPGTSLAEHMIGDDPEPEGGWRRFDEQGNLLPRKPPALTKNSVDDASKRPEPPPPGLGDFSKFISDGSDIRVGSDVLVDGKPLEPKPPANPAPIRRPVRIPPGVGDFSKFVSDGRDITLSDDPEPEVDRFDLDEAGNPTQARAGTRQAQPRKPMTWQEYASALPRLPAGATLEQWRAAVAEAEALLEQVDEPDRKLAGRIIGDTLMQSGVFLGYVTPEAAPQDHAMDTTSAKMTRDEARAALMDAVSIVDGDRTLKTWEAQWERMAQVIRRYEGPLSLEPLAILRQRLSDAPP